MPDLYGRQSLCNAILYTTLKFRDIIICLGFRHLVHHGLFQRLTISNHEFLKWSRSSLNLDLSTDANKGFSLKIKEKGKQCRF